MIDPRPQNERNGLPPDSLNGNGDLASESVHAEIPADRRDFSEANEPFDAIAELLDLSTDSDPVPPQDQTPETLMPTDAITQMHAELEITNAQGNRFARQSPELPSFTQSEIDVTEEAELDFLAQPLADPLQSEAEGLEPSADAAPGRVAQHPEQKELGDRGQSSFVSQRQQKALAVVQHASSFKSDSDTDLGVPMARLERREHRSSRRQNQAKPALFALAIAMLPVLLAGTTTYFAGQSIIDEQAIQLKQETLLDPVEIEQRQRRHLERLAILSLGTGAMAIVVGLIAAGLASRTLNAAVKGAADQTEQNAQKSLSQKSQALTAAVDQLRRSRSQADILEVAVDRIREILACDRVLVYCSNEDSERRVIAESVQLGFSSALDSTIADPLFVAKYLEPYERGVRVIEDVRQTGGSPADLQQFGTHAIQAMMAVPLIVQGERFGFVVAHDCSEPRAWQPSEMDLFHQLTTQVGFALDLAQTASERDDLKDRVALEAQWRGTFEQTTRLIHESLAADEILEAAVIETRRVLACDRVVVYSLNVDHQGVIISESAAPGCLRVLGRTITDPCFEAKYIEMYADGRVRAVNDIHAANLSPCYVEQLEQLSVKANLVAPVIREGQLMGLLVAHQCSDSRDWKELEIRWFTQIAVQVGYALDNANFKQQAEQKAQTLYQEQAGVQAAVSQLLQAGKVTLETLSTGSAAHLDTIGTVVDQLQAIADASRQMAAKAQKAEQERQGVSQTLKSGYTSVNQAVDVMTGIQETVANSSSTVEELGAVVQSIAQIVDLIHEAAEPMGQLAINLSISSGRSGDQGAMVETTEAVLACAQQVTAAATQLQPLVAQMGQDAQTIMGAMEMGTEQAVVGTELARQTRHHLNQLTAYEDALTALLQKLVDVIPVQTQTLSSTRQSLQGVLTLTTQTLEKSTELSAMIRMLETTVQGF
jgi:GAF domain-containing protein